MLHTRVWQRGYALAALATAFFAAPMTAGAHGKVDPAILRMVQPGQPLVSPADGRDALIEAGRRLFLAETFGGNGRTCGTCHPPSNNFTLDPAFIRSLPRTDPLFVNERNPALRELENSRLLRRAALILENLDGFDKPGVMRSVPHTLGLSHTVTPDAGSATRPPFPLANATGWSGDGAPGSGSLREFAIGAVVQHAPKTLNRLPGVDFRLPTEAELDAILAFQLSLGRQAEVNIGSDPAVPDPLVFTDAFVEQGKQLFNGATARDGSTRACSGCHFNAGANDRNGNNRNFATGVAFLANSPPCLSPVGAAAGDGGFGQDPVTVVNTQDLCGIARFANVTFRGDLTMNTPSLIEAADTAPFFHNNAARTLEDAVAFYTTDVFNDSTAGGGRAFVFDTTQINALGAVLRTLNAIDNIRASNAHDEQAIAAPSRAGAREIITLAVNDTRDAIEVLTQGPVQLYANTNVVRLLRRAVQAQLDASASANPDPSLRRAVELKNQARSLMTQ
jgi:cytochrome c peroxidase